MIELYLAFPEGIRQIDPIRWMGGYECSPVHPVWNEPPGGKKIGDFATKELAFAAMNTYLDSIKPSLSPLFGGFKYTLTKQRKDGLYVVFFDSGKDKDGLCGRIQPSCVDFILLNK